MSKCFMCKILSEKERMHDAMAKAMLNWDHESSEAMQWTGLEYVKGCEYDSVKNECEKMRTEIVHISKAREKRRKGNGSRHPDIRSLYRLGDEFMELRTSCELILPAVFDNVDRGGDESALREPRELIRSRFVE
jgi:hypothetical protein